MAGRRCWRWRSFPTSRLFQRTEKNVGSWSLTWGAYLRYVEKGLAGYFSWSTTRNIGPSFGLNIQMTSFAYCFFKTDSLLPYEILLSRLLRVWDRNGIKSSDHDVWKFPRGFSGERRIVRWIPRGRWWGCLRLATQHTTYFQNLPLQ